MKHAWLAPAAASLAFFAFSLHVIAREGPFGFLDEHLRTAWGAQIGVDLVLSASIALVFAAPTARRLGVRLWPWVLLTCATGSIGLLALAARLAYAASESGPALPGASASRAVAAS